MKRPAFQFYPKDWTGNMKLRRCSDAAKGAWIQVLCVLHDSAEYGVARFPLTELVSAAGVKPASVKELVDKGVLKGADAYAPAYVYTPRHAGKDGPPVTLLEQATGPMWYSSRFVRDEYRRTTAGADTRFKSTTPPGGLAAGLPPNPTPTPRLGAGSAFAVASALDSSQGSDTGLAVEPVRSVDNSAEGGTANPRAHGKQHRPRTVEDVVAMGRRVGLTARVGESTEAFEHRVRTHRA